MKSLLKKEFTLSMHPTGILFLGLSAMLLIPNYPYLVSFFYTGLAVFFICLNGRENGDIPFMMLLPVAKRDLVRARFMTVVALQIAQIILSAHKHNYYFFCSFIVQISNLSNHFHTNRQSFTRICLCPSKCV